MASIEALWGALCVLRAALCEETALRCYETGTDRVEADLVMRVEIPPLRFGRCAPFAPVGMTGLGELACGQAMDGSGRAARQELGIHREHGGPGTEGGVRGRTRRTSDSENGRYGDFGTATAEFGRGAYFAVCVGARRVRSERRTART